MSWLQRELAFWIQFAEIWKDLAELSQDPVRRAECLKRARMCLWRAGRVRQKIETPPGGDDEAQSRGNSTNTTVS